MSKFLPNHEEAKGEVCQIKYKNLVDPSNDKELNKHEEISGGLVILKMS